jgi:hypothetical protein
VLGQRLPAMFQLGERSVCGLQVQQGQLCGRISFQRRLLDWGRRTSTDR